MVHRCSELLRLGSVVGARARTPGTPCCSDGVDRRKYCSGNFAFAAVGFVILVQLVVLFPSSLLRRPKLVGWRPLGTCPNVSDIVAISGGNLACTSGGSGCHFVDTTHIVATATNIFGVQLGEATASCTESVAAFPANFGTVTSVTRLPGNHTLVHATLKLDPRLSSWARTVGAPPSPCGRYDALVEVDYTVYQQGDPTLKAAVANCGASSSSLAAIDGHRLLVAFGNGQATEARSTGSLAGAAVIVDIQSQASRTFADGWSDYAVKHVAVGLRDPASLRLFAALSFGAVADRGKGATALHVFPTELPEEEVPFDAGWPMVFGRTRVQVAPLARAGERPRLLGGPDGTVLADDSLLLLAGLGTGKVGAWQAADGSLFRARLPRGVDCACATGQTQIAASNDVGGGVSFWRLVVA